MQRSELTWFLCWYKAQTYNAKMERCWNMHLFKLKSGQDPLIATGELKDMAAEMRAIGLAADDPMFFICLLGALLAAFEAEVVSTRFTYRSLGGGEC